MSHLLAPQDEKRDTRVAQSEPALNDPSFLVPPQEEKSEKAPTIGRRSWLIPLKKRRSMSLRFAVNKVCIAIQL